MHSVHGPSSRWRRRPARLTSACLGSRDLCGGSRRFLTLGRDGQKPSRGEQRQHGDSDQPETIARGHCPPPVAVVAFVPVVLDVLGRGQRIEGRCTEKVGLATPQAFSPALPEPRRALFGRALQTDGVDAVDQTQALERQRDGRLTRGAALERERRHAPRRGRRGDRGAAAGVAVELPAWRTSSSSRPSARRRAFKRADRCLDRQHATQLVERVCPVKARVDQLETACSRCCCREMKLVYGVSLVADSCALRGLRGQRRRF